MAPGVMTMSGLSDVAAAQGRFGQCAANVSAVDGSTLNAHGSGAWIVQKANAANEENERTRRNGRAWSERGEKGERGPAGPVATRSQILAAVQNEFDSIRRELACNWNAWPNPAPTGFHRAHVEDDAVERRLN